MAKAKKETTSESTALVVITPEEQAYLDSLASSSPSPVEFSGPDRLDINTNSKDEDGVKRPIGAWRIANKKAYYDGVATFRPVRYAYKLVRYNQDAEQHWNIVGQSIYFNDFTEEILDSLGGVALGRKFGKQYTDEEKLATKKLAETYMDIFGFVKFDTDEEYPVMFRVRGSKLMKMGNAFKALPKDKRYSQYNYKLETFQPSGKTYWDMTVEPDMSELLPITPILQYDAAVLDYIRESNNAVLTAHTKNRGSKAEDTIAASVVAKMVDVTPKKVVLDDDEIPF